MKNPLPSMARSSTLDEVVNDPCEKFPCTDVSATPMPVWIAPDPPEIDELIKSANVALLPLKPTVLRLAMLLPMTESAVPLALSPLTPANNDDRIPMGACLLLQPVEIHLSYCTSTISDGSTVIVPIANLGCPSSIRRPVTVRSEEHTSELQSRRDL